MLKQRCAEKLACAVCAIVLAAGAAARGSDEILVIKQLGIAGVEALLSQTAIAQNPDVRCFDLNGDDLRDLVIRASNGVEVFLTTSQPGTQYVAEKITIQDASVTGVSFAADMDQDSLREIVLRHTGGISVVHDAGVSRGGGGSTLLVPGNFMPDAFGGTASDVDGDGDDDLIACVQAIVGNNAPKCRIYLNSTPAGGNAAPANFSLSQQIELAPIPANPQEFSSVSAGLINADAHVDIALVNVIAGACYLMAGNGDGTFNPIDPVTGAAIPGGNVAAGAIAAGSNPFQGILVDLDHDNDADLIVIGGENIVRFGNGDGTFGPQLSFGAGGPSGLFFPLTGDVNDDGTNDIITLNNSAGFTVTLVNPNQTLQSTQVFPTLHNATSAAVLIPEAGAPPWLVVGGGGKLVVHRNVEGVIGSFQRFQDTSGGGGVRDMVVGDFNGDGYLDAWYSTYAQRNRVVLNAGDGSGRLGSALILGQSIFNAAPAVFIERPALGRGSVAFPQSGPSTLYVGTVNEAGTQLQYGETFLMPDSARDVATLDLNDDGFRDLAVLHAAANPGISILNQQADGSFAPPFGSFDLSSSNPAQGWWTAFAPYEDAFTEGVFVTGPGGAGMYVENGAGLEFFSAFDAGFSGGVRVAASDLNGDGRADAVVGRDLGGNAGALAISIRNAGSPPTFAPPVTVNLIAKPTSIDIADLDNDNDRDIVVLCNDGALALQWATALLNNGSGAFPEEDITQHIVGQNPSRVHLADLHNAPSSIRGDTPATAGPEIIAGGNGPGNFTGFQVHENIVDFAPPPQCLGDANRDGTVGFPDVISVLANWGTNYAPGSGIGDADYSGFVDFPDVISVLAHWQQTCVP